MQPDITIPHDAPLIDYERTGTRNDMVDLFITVIESQLDDLTSLGIAK